MEHDYSIEALLLYVATLLTLWEMACELMLYLNLRYREVYCPVHGWESLP